MLCVYTVLGQGVILIQWNFDLLELVDPKIVKKPLK